LVSHQPDLEFQFKVLDSPVVNAFAVPGGFVYMTRGILSYLNDEAELAGVMGHEIGHVTARHSAQLYSQAQVAQIGLAVGGALSKTFQKFAGLAEAGLTPREIARKLRLSLGETELLLGLDPQERERPEGYGARVL